MERRRLTPADCDGSSVDASKEVTGTQFSFKK